MAELEDRMGNLIQSFFADPFQAITAAPAVPVWVPPVDIEETDDSYILEMDLPGVKAENLNLELRDNNELRVTGQYSERERTGMMRRQSRRGGQFEYDVILPGDVDAENIDASLEEGVLVVRLGKARAGQARRIEVKGKSTAGTTGQAATGAATGGAATSPRQGRESQTRVSPGDT
ncbi:Hsp20/alpha crystallin family protein [Planosporangium sp. 12N6]|uniref:Hsp20/alpha crystallin family protein n=1 Tax=Planosporangium spinosum TaxID=3402278 RepID=UPI003CF42E6C